MTNGEALRDFYRCRINPGHLDDYPVGFWSEGCLPECPWCGAEMEFVATDWRHLFDSEAEA